jgi:hypothetical protein
VTLNALVMTARLCLAMGIAAAFGVLVAIMCEFGIYFSARKQHERPRPECQQDLA